MKTGALVHEGGYSPTVASERSWTRYAAPAGRVLFALYFLISGARHFLGSTVQYAASAGVPMPGLLVPLSGAIILAGAVSVIIGLYARVGAALLIVFLVPVTLMMHQFWDISDPMMASVQEAAFFKNVCLIGTALMLLYWGAGPVSVDAARARKSPVEPPVVAPPNP